MFSSNINQLCYTLSKLQLLQPIVQVDSSAALLVLQLGNGQKNCRCMPNQ